MSGREYVSPALWISGVEPADLLTVSAVSESFGEIGEYGE